MQFEELSSRMVDVLGISLTRLLVACQDDALLEKIIFKNVLAHYIKIEMGDTIFQWFKCPKHKTWLQPEYKPFPHWACWFWQGCEYKKAAKLRTIAEREIFQLAKFLDDKGEHA